MPTTFSLSKRLSSPRRIGALALMATAGEGSYEVGGGGKFRKRPFRRPQTTPYDRPPNSLRNTRNGWLSKVVDPASRLITASAHRFFDSVFRRRLPPPPLPRPLPPPPGSIHFTNYYCCYSFLCFLWLFFVCLFVSFFSLKNGIGLVSEPHLEWRTLGFLSSKFSCSVSRVWKFGCPYGLGIVWIHNCTFKGVEYVNLDFFFSRWGVCMEICFIVIKFFSALFWCKLVIINKRSHISSIYISQYFFF